MRYAKNLIVKTIYDFVAIIYGDYLIPRQVLSAVMKFVLLFLPKMPLG